MFEDVKRSDENVVTGDPSKVEDMFGKVDPTPDLKSAVQGGRLTPVQPVGQPMSQAQAPQNPTPGGPRIGPPNPLTNLSQVDQWSRKRSGKSWKIAVLVIIALMVVGGVFAYVFWFAAPVTLPTNQTTNESVNQPASVTNQPAGNVNAENGNQAPSIPTNALIDTDGDGLTDFEEESFGTDVNLVDTDADGLNDRDELRVYKTNPLLSDSDNDGLTDRDEVFTWKTDPNNQDTDGDTYLDGVEVQNGYNPNGSGKLPPEVSQGELAVPLPVE